MQYRCRLSECGAINDEWLSSCPVCGEDGTMVPLDAFIPEGRSGGGRLVSKAKDHKTEEIPRLKSGIDNLDILYGGEDDPGIPGGFVIQLTGPPGIGKSTLVTQIAGGPLYKDVLYVATEESASRVVRRLRRLRMRHAEDAQITHTQDLPTVLRAIREVNAKVVIVDSLHGLRLHAPEIPDEEDDNGLVMNMPKHTQQTVRDIAFQLIREAQKHGRTIFLLAHVNKENIVAGLREVEHMVDVVSYFEGSPKKIARTARCTKDRESDTTYTAHFKMTNIGLVSYDPKREKLEEEDDDSEGDSRNSGAGQGGRGGNRTLDLESPPPPRRKEKHAGKGGRVR